MGSGRMIAMAKAGICTLGLITLTYPSAAEDFDPVAVAVSPNIPANEMSTALEDELKHVAKILELGCEDDQGAQCHTIVGDIRVVAMAREEHYPTTLVVIQAPLPMDENKLILCMAIISVVRPDIEKPKVGAAVDELIRKAARLSKEPSVDVDGVRLSIQIDSQNLLLGVSKVY